MRSALDTQHSPTDDQPSTPVHKGHGWMMIACCIPMLIIAVALVASGIASAGLLFGAVACTAMMAMMMRGMSGGDGKSHSGHA